MMPQRFMDGGSVPAPSQLLAFSLRISVQNCKKTKYLWFSTPYRRDLDVNHGSKEVAFPVVLSHDLSKFYFNFLNSRGFHR
jgi:hypothetical protein